MNDAILIFTFSPIQAFISEARRAGDLFVASRILSDLARAAATAIKEKTNKESVIYPILDGDDAPNVIVARVPKERAVEIAESAKNALLDKWSDLVAKTQDRMKRDFDFVMDDEWKTVWERQAAREYFWQVYWVTAELESDSPDAYKPAYERARKILGAVKTSRIFMQTQEKGFKDSLSGQREALELRTRQHRKISAAMLRPDGRERLDALGAVKRFSEYAAEKFPSVSTVASAPFTRACKDAGLLDSLRREIRQFNMRVGDDFFYPIEDFGRGFEFDGDLLYRETYAPERLRASYGEFTEAPEKVTRALESLYEAARARNIQPNSPSPYYAILVMDGDDMGRHISACRDKAEHRKLSERLGKFTDDARKIIEQDGFLIYAGGDDVLALLPLQNVLRVAVQLQDAYGAAFKGWDEEALPIRNGRRVPFTLSAGIAIAHHLYPLDAALKAARAAEEEGAKKVKGKAAVSVYALKRGGETLQVRSGWESMMLDGANLFETMVNHFSNQRVSSRFAYDLYERARIATALEQDARKAIVQQLVERHRAKDKMSATESKMLVEQLSEWAHALDSQVQPEKDTKDKKEIAQGLTEVGRWVVLARFIAQGGGE